MCVVVKSSFDCGQGINHFVYQKQIIYFAFYYRTTKPEKTTFHLLHLSLFREYLDWEFSELKVT